MHHPEVLLGCHKTLQRGLSSATCRQRCRSRVIGVTLRVPGAAGLKACSCSSEDCAAYSVAVTSCCVELSVASGALHSKHPWACNFAMLLLICIALEQEGATGVAGYNLAECPAAGQVRSSAGSARSGSKRQSISAALAGSSASKGQRRSFGRGLFTSPSRRQQPAQLKASAPHQVLRLLPADAKVQAAT